MENEAKIGDEKTSAENKQEPREKDFNDHSITASA
jgi:hypothetical protein